MPNSSPQISASSGSSVDGATANQATATHQGQPANPPIFETVVVNYLNQDYQVIVNRLNGQMTVNHPDPPAGVLVLMGHSVTSSGSQMSPGSPCSNTPVTTTLAKAKPRVFDGEIDAASWFSSLEIYLSANGISSSWAYAKAVIQTLMSGQALAWFQSIQLTSFNDFKMRFKSLYIDTAKTSKLNLIKKQSEYSSIRSFAIDVMTFTNEIHKGHAPDITLKAAIYNHLEDWYKVKTAKYVYNDAVSCDEYVQKLADREEEYKFEMRSRPRANLQPAQSPANRNGFQQRSQPLQPTTRPQQQIGNQPGPSNQRSDKYCTFCRRNNHSTDECRNRYNRPRVSQPPATGQRQLVKVNQVNEYESTDEADESGNPSADEEEEYSSYATAAEDNVNQSRQELLYQLHQLEDAPPSYEIPQPSLTSSTYALPTVMVDALLRAKTLVDTGCTAAAIISERFLVRLNESLVSQGRRPKTVLNTNTSVRLADDSVTQSLKATWIMVGIGNKYAAVVFALIIPQLNFDLIIGVPIIRSAKIAFDHTEMKCYATAKGCVKLTNPQQDTLVFYCDPLLEKNSDLITLLPGESFTRKFSPENKTAALACESLYAVFESDSLTVVTHGTEQTIIATKPTTLERGCTFNLNKTRPFKILYNARIENLFEDEVLDKIDINPDLDSIEVGQIRDVILKHINVFQKDEFDIGLLSTKKAVIDTGNARPIRLKPYPLAKPSMLALEKIVNRFKTAQILVPNTGPWAFPVFIQVKKDKPRMLCDIRRLNALIEPLPCPLPNIRETIRTLTRSTVFGKLDMPDGYFQMELEESSQQKAGIAYPGSQSLMYTRVPQGLSTAVAQFSEAISILYDRIPRDERTKRKCVHPYLDDTLVHGETVEEMCYWLDKVLEAHALAGSKLNAKKIQLGYNQIEFLGMIIGKDGIRPDPNKVEALKKIRLPVTITETRSFIGLVNYLAPWIKDATKLLLPYFELIKNAKSKTAPVELGPSHLESHRKLLDYLTSTDMVLALFDEDKQLVMETDACDFAMAAVLYQKEKDETKRPLGYFGKKFRAYELSMTTIEKEACAIVNACDFFETFILSSKKHLIVRTDNCGLCFIFTMKNINHKVTRWAMKLSKFKVTIEHIKGAQNFAADHLSRYIAFIADTVHLFAVTPHDSFQLRQRELKDIIKELKNSHLKEPFFIKVLEDLPSGKKMQFTQRNGTLYKKVLMQGRKAYHLALCVSRNEKCVKDILLRIHNESHLGREKLYHLIRLHLYWPKMFDDISALVDSCEACKLNKPNYHPAKPVARPINLPPQVNEQWAIDFSGPYDETATGNKYILAAIDRCSRFLVAEATINQTEETVILFLRKRLFPIFGYPVTIKVDNGPCFRGNKFKALLARLQIGLDACASFDSTDRPLVERVQGTIQLYMRTATAEDKLNWEEHLSTAVTYYNACTHANTGYSPYELQFARPPALNLLPFDSEQPLPVDGEVDPFALFGKLRRTVNPTGLTELSSAQKDFKIGDLVVIETSRRSKTKLEPTFKGPYIIIEKWPNGNFTLSLVAKQNSAKPSLVTVNSTKMKRFSKTHPPPVEPAASPEESTSDQPENRPSEESNLHPSRCERTVNENNKVAKPQDRPLASNESTSKQPEKPSEGQAAPIHQPPVATRKSGRTIKPPERWQYNNR